MGACLLTGTRLPTHSESDGAGEAIDDVGEAADDADADDDDDAVDVHDADDANDAYDADEVDDAGVVPRMKRSKRRDGQ